MDDRLDVDATEALIQATLEADQVRKNATKSGSWQSTLDELLVIPTSNNADKIKNHPSSLKDNNAVVQKFPHPLPNRYNRSKNPIKTTAPPSVIKLEAPS